MFELWYLIVVAAVSVGTFFGIWLSEIVLRREWNRLAKARKNVNDNLREVEARLEEWRQLQGAAQGWRGPNE